MSETRELVARALRGDMDAFGALIRMHYHGAYAAALALLGDRDDASDVVQESFLSAYRGLTDLADPDRFRPWLHRIVVRQCGRQGAREARCRDAASLQATEGETPPPPSATSGAVGALADLPEHLRTCATLRWLHDHSIREIAECLGIPEGTVKRRLHDARRRMSEELRTMDGEERILDTEREQCAETVLSRLGLGFPPGTVTSGYSEDRERVFTLLSTSDAADLPGAEGVVALTLDALAAEAAVSPVMSFATAEEAARDLRHAGATSRAEVLDVFARVLRALDVRTDRVALDVEGDGQLTATASLANHSGSIALDLPPSVALALAFRAKAALYATPRLLQRGVAGDGVASELTADDVAGLKAEVLSQRRADALLDMAWRGGLDPDEKGQTVRWRVVGDEAHVLVGGGSDAAAVVPTRDHADGLARLRGRAERGDTHRLLKDGRLYEVAYRTDGDEIVCTARKL